MYRIGESNLFLKRHPVPPKYSRITSGISRNRSRAIRATKSLSHYSFAMMVRPSKSSISKRAELRSRITCFTEGNTYQERFTIPTEDTMISSKLETIHVDENTTATANSVTYPVMLGTLFIGICFQFKNKTWAWEGKKATVILPRLAS